MSIIEKVFHFPELLISKRLLGLPALLLFEKFLDLVETCETFLLEVFELLNNFSEESFFDETVDQLFVVLGSVEASKYLHCVYDLSLLLGLFAFKFLNLFEIKQISLNDKLLSPDSLV